MSVGPTGALTLVVMGLTSTLILAALGGAVIESPAAAGGNVADIPPAYLIAYRAAAARFELGADGWSYLAAIGKVESDHGRSRAPGVRSGQNAYGCCAGPMQIHNGFGSGGGTWGAYKVDGDGDGRTDIYDPDDAIATAARYLRASGAPTRWRAAIFSYNHADWYVRWVLQQASAYRAASEAAGVVGPPTGEWLAPVPGSPGERCDRRIVADVVYLTRRYGLKLTDCFGGAPHALAGEHPLGLAADLVPASGDWDRTLRLAIDSGWSQDCASSGCPGRGPFRVVLYNGYPGHGDPAHSGTPHLHLSWQHGPAERFTPAPWVRVLLPSGSGVP
jgi:hypothetical protein